MGFYVRKSISAGPFRFNFSSGGVGASVGVKGLRIGTGPRGHYIHAGVGGLYYRGTLGKAGAKKVAQLSQNPPAPQPRPQSSPPEYVSDGVVMREIESRDVVEMRDETFASVLDEINARQSQTRLSVALAVLFGIGGFLVGTKLGGAAPVLGIGAFVPGMLLGKWFDSYSRVSVLYYDLEQDAEAAYGRLVTAFDTLTRCAGKWHVAAGGKIEDLTAWKRNAGATMLVDKKSTTLESTLPKVVRSNVTPPSLHVGRQILYFMPDLVLVKDGNRYGAVGYGDLRTQFAPTNFIETGKVPSDAEIVSYTWAHPNKNGGPDKRFKDNRQIPVCLYEALRLSSSSGLNELVEFSKTNVSQPFCQALSALAQLHRSSGRQSISLNAHSRE
ncbi:membrane protein [Mesorhizobium sp. LSJC268A00]|uniref:DUF4236 domain-containing protein n=1 Tax=unclassified Mesorhizobium TaxID=325217 RepID=UPI0003CEAD64|nr:MULTISPECIES: DUF4236 domain-containing protein [unclassified Mesorhizobium]ESX03672.1 membrane protein [Mesorhizobium sp. LSJC268A00]